MAVSEHCCAAGVAAGRLMDCEGVLSVEAAVEECRSGATSQIAKTEAKMDEVRESREVKAFSSQQRWEGVRARGPG